MLNRATPKKEVLSTNAGEIRWTVWRRLLSFSIRTLSGRLKTSAMKTQGTAAAIRKKDRLIQERVHDPYRTKRKLSGTTVCPVCQAVFHEGRWQWAEAWPAEATRELCQACHRTQDNYPAVVVTLTGAWLQNQEKQENAQHPLHRIMRLENHPDSIVIKTTDIHFPHRIVEALRHACKGGLDIHHDEQGYFVRANWKRER